MIRLTTELLTLGQESAPEPIAKRGTLAATAPKVVRLPVRDRDAARRRAARLDAFCTIVGILAVVALAAWCAGLIGTRGNVLDRQPMGEVRTERAQEVERG